MAFCSSVTAKNIVINADCRQRPPEMKYNEEKEICSGPLIDILNLAAKKIGGTIHWERRPFQKSFSLLRRGKIDILPRVIKTKERQKDVKYFSPIGYQVKNIVFAVKKGHENDIQKFEDLQNFRIGAKRGTAYFDQFNNTSSIYKISAVDDVDLTRKFIGGRCDAAIILDIKAFEKMMKSMKFSDYAYAKYKYTNKIGNHYVMSLKSKYFQLFDKINNILKQMNASGEIKNIYHKYSLDPPVTDASMN
jgi:polar amino acid transport system substrate-binding protein